METTRIHTTLVIITLLISPLRLIKSVTCEIITNSMELFGGSKGVEWISIYDFDPLIWYVKKCFGFSWFYVEFTYKSNWYLRSSQVIPEVKLSISTRGRRNIQWRQIIVRENNELMQSSFTVWWTIRFADAFGYYHSAQLACKRESSWFDPYSIIASICNTRFG